MTKSDQRWGVMQRLMALESDFPESIMLLLDAVPTSILPKFQPFSLCGMPHKTVTCSATTTDFIAYIREAAILEHIKHPHIMRLKSWTWGNDSFGLQLAPEDCISLNSFISDWHPHPLCLRRILAQAFEAVAHCHTLRVIHCNLQTARILVDSRGRAKVTRFGTATASALDIGPVAPSLSRTPFMAPEWIRKPSFDMFSLGVILADCEDATSIEGQQCATPLAQ